MLREIIGALGRKPARASREQYGTIGQELLGTAEELAAIRKTVAVGGKIPAWQKMAPQYPSSNHRSLITMGYNSNPAVRGCIDIITRAFNQGRLCVVDNVTGEEAPDNEIVRMIKYPTNAMGSIDRWNKTLQDLFLTGSAIWEKVRDKRGNVVELWRLDPARVKIEVTEAYYGTRYWYEVGGKWYPIDLVDIVHWKFNDPLDSSWFGIPPLMSALKSMHIDNEISDMMKVTLENRAVPSVVLNPRDPNRNVSHEKAEEVRRGWMRNIGRKNRGGVVVSNFAVEVVGMSWKDMALGEIVSVPESRIAMVHGVPIILLGRSGTQGDPTRANFEQAQRHFWYNTIAPLHAQIAELIELYILPEFPGWESYSVKFDSSSVPLLQSVILENSEAAAKLFEAGMVSRHEAQRLGGVTIHGPDVFYRKVNVDSAIPADSTEEDVEKEL